MALAAGNIPDTRESFDWERLASLAVAHNLAPILFHRLLEPPHGAPVLEPPPEIRSRLEKDYYFCWSLTTLQGLAADAIFEALDRRGIDAIVLKGALFARSLYPRPELRPMSDIDFLVRPEDLEAAGTVLEELGYRPSPPGRRPATMEEMFERHYAKRAAGLSIAVEPHRALGPPARYRVGYEGLWRRAEPSGVAGWPARALRMSAEDNLLHLGLHQANALFDGVDLRSVLDAHFLIVQGGPDWWIVAARARQWGLLTPLHLLLESCRRLLRTPIPTAALDATRPGRVRLSWLERWIDTKGLGLYRNPHHSPMLKRVLIGFALIDRFGDRMRSALWYTGLRARDRLATLRRAPPARRKG